MSRTTAYGRNVFANETIEFDKYNQHFAVGFEIIDQKFKARFMTDETLFKWQATNFGYNATTGEDYEIKVNFHRCTDQDWD